MNTPCTTTRRRVRSALYIQAQLRRAAYETVRSSRRHTTGREHPSPRRAQGQIADRCHPDLPSASREEPAMEMWKTQRTRFPHSHSPNLILNEHTRGGEPRSTPCAATAAALCFPAFSAIGFGKWFAQSVVSTCDCYASGDWLRSLRTRPDPVHARPRWCDLRSEAGVACRDACRGTSVLAACPASRRDVPRRHGDADTRDGAGAHGRMARP